MKLSLSLLPLICVVSACTSPPASLPPQSSSGVPTVEQHRYYPPVDSGRLPPPEPPIVQPKPLPKLNTIGGMPHNIKGKFVYLDDTLPLHFASYDGDWPTYDGRLKPLVERRNAEADAHVAVANGQHYLFYQVLRTSDPIPNVTYENTPIGMGACATPVGTKEACINGNDVIAALGSRGRHDEKCVGKFLQGSESGMGYDYSLRWNKAMLPFCINR